MSRGLVSAPVAAPTPAPIRAPVPALPAAAPISAPLPAPISAPEPARSPGVVPHADNAIAEVSATARAAGLNHVIENILYSPVGGTHGKRPGLAPRSREAE